MERPNFCPFCGKELDVSSKSPSIRVDDIGNIMKVYDVLCSAQECGKEYEILIYQGSFFYQKGTANHTLTAQVEELLKKSS